MIITSGRGYTFLLEAGTVFDKPNLGRFWLYGLKNIGSSDEKANTAIDSIVAQMSIELKHDHEVRLKYFSKRYDSAANLIYQLQF